MIGSSNTPLPNSLGAYRLRWRIDYKDKPSRYGVWDEKSSHKTDKFWHVDREGFLQVVIEGEDLRTRERKNLVSLASWDFVTMTVEAYSRLKTLGKQNPCFAGLSLVSTDRKVTVLTSGHVSINELN